ncbi:MAG: efflux RND transporter permease subunit, partial [Sedimentibacter sp.]
SSASGNKVLIKQVADILVSPQILKINKYDRDKTIIIGSDVKSGYSSVAVQNALEQQLKDKDFGKVRVVFDGEREAISKDFGELGIISIFALLIIYMILMIQFGSLVQPLIIMISIPLSIIGSVVGLYIFRQPLSLTALFGIVSLIGIVVNNAIILVDYVNFERKEGKMLEDACKEAVTKRFRPVMLTTITTIIGLIPLAFSGSSLFAPMSIALMSGLIVSTLLTLVVIPVVFSLVMGKTDK